MLMHFYIGYAVRHTYTHNLQHPFKSGVPKVNSELVDMDVIYTPDQDKESGSGSDSDPKSNSICNLMDINDKDDDSMYISK